MPLQVKAADRDLKEHGHLTHKTAIKVQDALVVSLATGTHIPPCRLSLIKSWTHPTHTPNVKCSDKDCRSETCLGNHLHLSQPKEWEEEEEEEGEGEEGQQLREDDAWPWFDYNRTIISSHVLHSKNDKRFKYKTLTFNFPRGDLSKLMLTHIKQGHPTIHLESPTTTVNLFTTRQGNPFSDATFCHYWRTTIKNCPIAHHMGLSYFKPSAARNMFVEDYTGANGVAPDMWDGAAVLMGNSVRQWEMSYGSSKRKRGAQEAADSHARYMEGRAGSIPGIPNM